MDFDKAKAAAIKILGKDARFPKLPGDIAKEESSYIKVRDEARAVRDEFEKKLLIMKKALDSYIDTLDACKDVFEGSDFGLNPKDNGQKKQIDDATKTLTDPINAELKTMTTLKAVYDQVFKQISSIAKSFDSASR